jgi:hypothetical protein
MRTVPLLAACLALAVPAAVARAQDPFGNENVKFRSGLLEKKGSGPGLPDVKAQPQAWPRLDPGAVICRSEADLSRLAARRRGEPVQGPVDCQLIRVAAGIKIIQRKGPGMTQVSTNDPAAGGAGWTDAWLPEKAPANATSASR